MSVALENLVPVKPPIRARKADSLKSILPKMSDRIAARLLITAIKNSVVKPILEAKPGQTADTFDESLARFTTMASALSELIISNNIKDLSKVLALDQGYYENVTTYSRGTADMESRILEIIKTWDGYQNVIFGILNDRPEEFEKMAKEVNLDECVHSLYGTLLSVLCAGALLGSRRYQQAEKLKVLVGIGERNASNLDYYTDTIDILSNPAEMELLKKSDEIQ